tara:strand:+ start:2068 stop:2328 length:261 start_codon:yes stop_codon:yes gene_type:complete
MSASTPYISGNRYTSIEHYHDTKLENLKEFDIPMSYQDKQFIAGNDGFSKTNLHSYKGKGRHAKSISSMFKWRMKNIDKANYYKKG